MFHFHYSIILNVHVNNELGVERDRWVFMLIVNKIFVKKSEKNSEKNIFERLVFYKGILNLLPSPPSDVFFFFLETPTQFFIISHQKTFFKDVLSMSLQPRGTKTPGP